MKKKQDKRLISAMDYVDDKLVDRAAQKIKVRELGAPAEKPSKMKALKQVALLAACLLLLGAAVPLAVRLVNYIPSVLNPAGTGEETESDVLETNETEPPEVDAVPEEYFANGWLPYGGFPFNGAEYDGKWIFVTDLLASNIEALAVYDPVTGTTESICIGENCKHTGTGCMSVLGVGWYLNTIEIIDDWCLYQIKANVKYRTELRMYNMKTGEARLICEDVRNGDTVTYPALPFRMDGKVYLQMCEVDEAAGTRREYLSCYDLATDTTEFVCDFPEDLVFTSISSKRLFFRESRSSLFEYSVVWSTDYSGGDLKKEEVLNFDPLIISGTYAYSEISMVLNNYNSMLVYDIATDSTFTYDFGGKVKSFCVSEDRIAYVLEGDGKLYVSDLHGENREALGDYQNIAINLCKFAGDYLICMIKGGESTGMPDGDYALDLKTGEFKAIPALQG